MHRTLTRLGFLFAALAAVFGLLFVDNLVVVVRWWISFLGCGGDTAAMPETVSGLGAWLDWAAVDHSCVTTFIPFFGCATAARALLRAGSGQRPSPEFFPFFRSSDSLNVSLGLIGTLWGVILIGYYKLDTVDMADLMRCLHTALFSTLAAVVWVYLIDHPILRPWLGRRLSDAYGTALQDDDADVLQTLERLNEGARGLRAAWTENAETVRAFGVTVGSVRTDLESFAASGRGAGEALSGPLAEGVRAVTAELGRATEALEARFSRLDAEYGKLSELVLRLTESAASSARLQQAFAESAERLKADRDALSETLARTRDEAAAKLASVRDEDAARLAEARAEGAALRDRAAELEGNLKAATERAAELAETLRRRESDFESRLAALRDENAGLASGKASAEARAGVAEAAAARANTLLGKIRSAFGEDARG